MPTVLLLGANSDIGKACAHRFAQAGFDLLLTSRVQSVEQTAELAEELRTTHQVSVQSLIFDALDIRSHEEFYTSLADVPEVVLCAIGFLGDPPSTPDNSAESFEVLTANYVGLVSILDRFARDMKKRGTGHIIGISSVAGDRGRASNYHYGSSKAGFTAYLSGLRQALLSSGVHVCTVKPGFVDTKMLAGRPTPALLTTSSEQMATRIYQAYKRKEAVVYHLPIWRLIMWVIKHIPESIFKRLSL